MKIGLLGHDQHTLGFVAAAIASGHAVTWACELGPLADEVTRRCPGLLLAPYWETVLSTSQVDALIVADATAASPADGQWLAGEELRADQLRKLFQAGVPVLVSHPACSSMLVYYELDMIRRDTECVAVPFIATRWQPAVMHLAERLAEGELGVVQQAVLERYLADRSRAAVRSQFAGDADLLRQLFGEQNRLAAMGVSPRVEGASSDLDADFANLGLHLSGPEGVAARWLVVPAAPAELRAQLTVRGTGGRATLILPADVTAPATLYWDTSIGSESLTFQGNVYQDALDTLADAIAGQEVEPSWLDGCRSVELADTIERSLNKGRVVELHFEDYTEENTFKGTMTSLGCGVLLAGLVLMVVAAVAGRLGVRAADYWPFFLLAALVAFLLMQLLRFVLPGESSKNGADQA